MADRSAIEWTDSTWNPIRALNLKTGKVGWHCEHVTPGCEHCYAEGFNMRLGTGLPFKPGHRKDVEIFLDENMLTLPLRWKKPRKIFVGSMTDMFADFVTDAMLDRIFAMMGACDDQGSGHQFQVLTKRADRMRDYVSSRGHKAWNSCRLASEAWPARNVWLGVSCENQEQAAARIPLLLQTPAAVRFVSAEPLLGPIDLSKPFHSRRPYLGLPIDQNPADGTWHQYGRSSPHLDWVIAGGESGVGYRAMDPAWAKSLIDQCLGAGVAIFMKQMAGKKPIPAGLMVREFPNVN